MADRFSLVWDAYDSVEEQPCQLTEYAGSPPSDLASRRTFTRIVKQLQELGEFVLPPRFGFTQSDRCYLVHDRPQPRTAPGRLIGLPTGVNEQQAAHYFWSTLASLEALHTAPVPLYHGGLSLECLLEADDGSIRLTGLRCPSSTPAIPADAVRRADLYRAGVLAAQLLCNDRQGDPDPPLLWAKRAEALQDWEFATVLEWILSMPALRPGSAGEIRSLQGLLAEARECAAEGRREEAEERYRRAYALCGSALVQRAAARLREPGQDQPAISARPPSPSRRIRICDLATELEVQHQAVLDALPAVGVAGPKTQISTIDQEAANRVRLYLRATATAQFPVPTLEVQSYFCPRCRRVFPSGDRFCQDCGTALEEGQPSLYPPVPQIPTPAVTPFRRWRKAARPAAGAAAAMLFAIFCTVQYFSGGLKSEFYSAVNVGNLTVPNTRSAWVIYREAVQTNGANSTLAREFAATAAPLLDSRSRDAFDSWYRTSALDKGTWEEVAGIAEWRALLKPGPETQAEDAYARGMVAFSRKKYSIALTSFLEAVALKSNWPIALNGAGKAYYNLRQYALARQFYGRATEADPQWQFPYFNLANLYRDVLRNDVLAEKNFLKAIDLDPMRPSFRYGLATFYFQRGSAFWHKACYQYRRSLEAGSTDVLTAAESATAVRRIRDVCD